MVIPAFRLGGLAAAAIAAMLLLSGAARASTKWADLRVVTHTGRTLAEFRQYTGTTAVRASHKADCFGPSNPSSNKRYRLRGANALGVVKDALASDRDLRPLLINDAFVDDGFGLGVCVIGDFATEGFSYWYLAHDRVAASTGPNLIPLHNGDKVLWYFTSGSESGFPTELALRGPARARPGQAFRVKVLELRPDGSRHPAAGTTVRAGGKDLGTTDSAGRLEVTLPGSSVLKATRGVDDVPSNRLAVCVKGHLNRCPDAHGKRILGSAHGDHIVGTAGWDAIRSRRGRDEVDLRSGGRDRVHCGGGRDRVIVERGDRNDDIGPSCERVVKR
jgi:hypothetical protein